jgi:hypothetical protein
MRAFLRVVVSSEISDVIGNNANWEVVRQDVSLRKFRWSASFYGDPSMADSTGLYKEFLAERQEIMCYKWIESEKAGCDIGFERALLD